MADINLFRNSGNTVCLAVTASAHAAVQLGNVDGYSGGTAVVYNEGPNTAFLAFGGSTVQAAIPMDGAPALGMPVPSGATVEFTVSNSEYVSAICQASQSATIYITVGQGS